MKRHLGGISLLSLLSVSLAGCWGSSGPEVVVYTALDSEFSQPILDEFTARTHIQAQPNFDVESTKTVGLTERIIAEADRPRCDVFWNNEILHTLRLKKLGLLEPYRSAAAEDFPAMYRSAEGYWYGFAARARVIIVNTDLVPDDRRPRSIRDLADPKWKGRCGIAKPLFGTTATHAACLFAYWGDERAKEYFRSLKANQVQILAGNKQVALSVGGGELAFGLTDTDDAMIELGKALPVAIVYPDQPAAAPQSAAEEPTADGEEEALGTLFVPNTVAIIKGGPNPGSARRLVDYVLSPEVETRLAKGRSAQIPLSEKVDVEVRVKTPREIKPMEVDFEAAADKWEAAAKFIRDEFTGG
jgi:iron(III) transport system substrate-binding protein